MIVEAAPVSSPVQDLPIAISPAMLRSAPAPTGRAGTWSVSATALSGRARTPKLSCAHTSAAWKHCGGRALSSELTPIIGRSQKISSSLGRPTTSARVGDGLRIRPLSAIGLDRQIVSDGATWLDRQIIAEDRSEIRDSGFGREVNKAISRRARRLVEMGIATAKDGNVRVPVDTVATLERREVERVAIRWRESAA